MSDKTPNPISPGYSESTTTLASQFSTDTTNPLLQQSQDASKKVAKKKSLYQRYQDAKTGRNKTLSDEELLKYTGKTREQIVEWGKTAPGVAGNQAAGKLAMGGTTGLGGMAVGEGFGGWGVDVGREPRVGPGSKHDGTKKKDSDLKKEDGNLSKETD